MVGRQREERKIWQKVSYLQSNTENISLYRLREGNKPVCAAFVEAGEKQRP
jgi:DTW domain-containing protein YfiP